MNPLVMSFQYWRVVLWQFCESAMPLRTFIKVVHKCIARNQAKDVCSILQCLSVLQWDIWEFVDNSVAEGKKQNTLAIGKIFISLAFVLGSGSSDFLFGLLFEKVKPCNSEGFFFFFFWNCDHCKHSKSMCIWKFHFLLHTYLHCVIHKVFL